MKHKICNLVLWFFSKDDYDDDDDDDDDDDHVSIHCRLRLEKMFGLVYSPRERGTTSHYGFQVSLFFLLTRTVLFLESLLSLTMLFSG